MRKAFPILGGMLILALAGAIWYMAASLDTRIKHGLETSAWRVAGVPVRAGTLSLALRDGRAGLASLGIANPPGYRSADAIALGAIKARIAPDTLGHSPVVLTELTIAAPRIAYETGPNGQSNLDALRETVRAAMDTADGDGRRVVIDKVVIAAGTLTLADKAAGAVPLPAMTLRDIGRDQGGLSVAQAVGRILDALCDAAQARAMAASGPPSPSPPP